MERSKGNMYINFSMGIIFEILSVSNAVNSHNEFDWLL